MCYRVVMSEVGLREMRQHASDLVRRAQDGERVTITVAGRPAAMLGPVTSNVWRRWDDIADLLGDPVDPDWATDMDQVDPRPADPWARR
jgi:prevent-host-death family protein